jgi:hypothetical protein
MSLCYFEGAPLGIGATSYQPRWLNPYHADAVRLRRAVRYESMLDYCRQKNPQKMCFYRTYALGDVIMLIPVIRLFLRMLRVKRPVFLITGAHEWRALGGQQEHPVLRLGGDILVVRTRGILDYGAEVHINLDHCLEADHRGGPESELHRLEIYARTLGVPT